SARFACVNPRWSMPATGSHITFTTAAMKSRSACTSSGSDGPRSSHQRRRQDASHHLADRRVDELGGVGRHALSFRRRVVIVIGGGEALRSVVADDPNELVGAFDTPRAGERESELSSKRVDPPQPRIEEHIHGPRADPVVPKLVFHSLLPSGGRSLIAAQDADELRVPVW